MTHLIHRLENATEGQERELLLEALALCCPKGVDIARDFAFDCAINAHAWTSAAGKLVPEGWYYAVATDGAGAMAAVCAVPDCSDMTRAAFPWAALAAASVKARG